MQGRFSTLTRRETAWRSLMYLLAFGTKYVMAGNLESLGMRTTILDGHLYTWRTNAKPHEVILPCSRDLVDARVFVEFYDTLDGSVDYEQ